MGVGAAALGVAVLPFTSTTPDGVELRCGPAVFEVLMPADPAFDDIPENVDCPVLSADRLKIAGAALAGAVLVAAVTERRTRRGSTRRDTAWLTNTGRTRKVGRARSRRAKAKARPAGPPSAIRRSSSSPRSSPARPAGASLPTADR